MKTKGKKMTALLVAGCLVASSNMPNEVNAKNVETTNLTEVNTCINFSEQEAREMEKAIELTLENGIEQLKNEILLSNNEEKKSMLERYVKELEKAEISDMFETDPETGKKQIKVPCKKTVIEIEGKQYKTDNNGVVKSTVLNNSLENKEQEKITVKEDKILTDVEIEEKKDGTIELNHSISFQDFAKGAEKMGGNMSGAVAQKVTCKTYKKRKADGKHSFGHGVGYSPVFFDKNIVGCNKCDKSAKKNYTSYQFITGNSDCAQSTQLGLFASQNPIGAIVYYNSLHCLNEAMDAAENNPRANEYCNGKKKSDGHVNCSWFTGIGHTEEFHTHKYS